MVAIRIWDEQRCYATQFLSRASKNPVKVEDANLINGVGATETRQLLFYVQYPSHLSAKGIVSGHRKLSATVKKCVCVFYIFEFKM